MGLIQQRTEHDVEGLLELAEIVVTTLGKDGAEIATRERTVHVPAAPITLEEDPVGAGDAFRGGLVHGLLSGRSLEEAGRIAALAGAYVVERPGATTHHYTRREFEERTGRHSRSRSAEPHPAGTFVYRSTYPERPGGRFVYKSP